MSLLTAKCETVFRRLVLAIPHREINQILEAYLTSIEMLEDNSNPSKKSSSIINLTSTQPQSTIFCHSKKIKKSKKYMKISSRKYPDLVKRTNIVLLYNNAVKRYWILSGLFHSIHRIQRLVISLIFILQNAFNDKKCF